MSIFSILYQENIIQKEVAREFVFKNWVANIFVSIFNNIYQENITVEEVLHKIFLKFGLLFYIFTYLLYLPLRQIVSGTNNFFTILLISNYII